LYGSIKLVSKPCDDAMSAMAREGTELVIDWMKHSLSLLAKGSIFIPVMSRSIWELRFKRMELQLMQLGGRSARLTNPVGDYFAARNAEERECHGSF